MFGPLPGREQSRLFAGWAEPFPSLFRIDYEHRN